MLGFVTASVISWLLHPDLKPLLRHGSLVFLAVVAAMLFAESGILVGIVLPGDSLLFSAGLLAGLAGRPNIVALIICCFVAAFLGDQVGYAFGSRVGPSLFTRPNSRLFKQENVIRSQQFFERHGPRALVLARFVPVVRTFVPILAGVSRMHYRRFIVFNAIGAAGWACLATLLGYLLGKRFPGLERSITPILAAIVLLSLLPIGIEVLRNRRAATPQQR
jgi:membrane-associated protein